MAAARRGVGNLPAELTSFVGRRGEVAEVRRLLAESRLVTLTGVGGVGKTRLALRAAARLRRAFRDGVWLVQLDQLREGALVAQAIAGALGVHGRAGAPEEALADYVADRQLLLVLDNCEQLVDAAAKLADLLLRGAAGLRVLATSRESLNIVGETVLPLAPLPAPEAGRPLTLAELARFPAVALFADRAGHAVPGFAVTTANMAAVAGICRRVEGLPLALELAAARLRVLSPEQIEARLGNRLGLLTGGCRANPARQQTLRASIAWSYELCSGPERLLWARLSVFAGGFELDAAEGICADYRLAAGDVLDLLAALADKSVLIAEHGEGGGVRYRLPETLREYGKERLQESGEYPTLRRRHRDWYEQLARQANAGWLSPQMTDRVALPAAAVHDRQRAHLLISLAIAAGLAGDEERVDRCQRELAALTETGGESVRRWHSAYCLCALGLAAWRRGDLDRAAALEQESLQLGEGLNDLRRSTVCLEALAWIAASGQQYQRAAVLLGVAAGLWRSMAVTLDGVEHLAGYQRDCYRQTRQALGEQAFQAAYARGLELPAEDAFAYAPQHSPAPAVPTAPAPTAPQPGTAPLTRRELQVARLLAGGRTNKQIAAQLVIAQRTAEGHVERILTKLGFTSRAEVAAWVARSQPHDHTR